MHDINLLNLIALKEKQAFIKVRAIATNQTSVSIGAGWCAVTQIKQAVQQAALKLKLRM